MRHTPGEAIDMPKPSIIETRGLGRQVIESSLSGLSHRDIAKKFGISHQAVTRYLSAAHTEANGANEAKTGRDLVKQNTEAKQSSIKAVPKRSDEELALLNASREAAKQSLARELYIAEQRFSKFLEEADLATDESEKAVAESKALQWFRAYQDATNKLLKASGQIRAAEVSAAKEAEASNTETIQIEWVGWG